MPTISFRISEEQKRALLRYGPLSSSIRDALRLYLDTKRSEQLLRKLQELQRDDHVRTTSVEDAKLIRKDRTR
jgi:Arc/MetJ-type ribon-helix-helix transcriptional regulator